MYSPDKRTSVAPSLSSRPRTDFCELATGSRGLILAAMTAMAFNTAACGDDVSSPPAPKGCVCVSVLGQQEDIPMTDCIFDYEAPAEGKAKNKCEEGELFIYGDPGTYAVEAECNNGKLYGTVQADIDAGKNEPQETHLAGSLCYDDQLPIVTDPAHREADLGILLGYSTPTHCANWFTYADMRQVDITALTLDCPWTESDCDPEDGRDLLTVKGENGQSSGGKAIHLTVVANTDLVLPGKEVTVWATVRERKWHEQETDIPVIVRGAEVIGGADADADSGN